MNPKLLTCSLATFALLGSGVAFGRAPTDDGHRPTVLLEADSSELGKRGTGLDKIVLERLGPGLEAEGIDTSGSISDIGVRVRVVPVDVEAFHYSVRFEIERDGAYAQVLGAIDCKPCIDSTLLAKIDARAPALADLIKERASEAEPTSEGTSEGPETGGEAGHSASTDDGGGDGAEDTSESATQTPVPKPIGALGFTGIGATALGLGVMIGGAVELSRGQVYDGAPGSQADYELSGTNHRPPGYALLGVGAAVVGAGLVMLGVDVGRRAKQRKRGRDQRARIVPTPIISPTRVGVGVAGQF